MSTRKASDGNSSPTKKRKTSQDDKHHDQDHDQDPKLTLRSNGNKKGETATDMAAPWKSVFQSHTSQMKNVEFALATVRHIAAKDGGAGSYVPRVRTCIDRGFWTEMKRNDKNPAPANPSIYQSSCLTFTTDSRMDKTADLFEVAAKGFSPALDGVEDKSYLHRSGGGAVVEALYWFKEQDTQWRITGKAYIIADHDIEGEHGRKVREALLSRMGKVEAAKEDGQEWSWKKEIIAHFGNLHPGMRGTFSHPSPGTHTGQDPKKASESAAKEEPEPSDKLGIQTENEETTKQDSSARENFRLVVIVPDVVEQTYIPSKEPQKQRRWRYTLDGVQPEKWQIEELWP